MLYNIYISVIIENPTEVIKKIFAILLKEHYRFKG